jgi:cell division protein FtsN
MQRANARVVPQLEAPAREDYPTAVHPLRRHALPAPQASQYQAPQYEDYPEEQAYQEPEPEQHADPSRYDEALYGQLESGAPNYQREAAYPDDPYAYQDGYEEEPEPVRKRGGLLTIVAVLTLAVVGTGAAFAYRTYVGGQKAGDPPIIKADNTPTKVIPAPADAASKTPDRMPLGGDGSEKIVPREEKPVDVNSGAPRVVFPPLTPNANPPPPASVATTAPPAAMPPSPAPTNGTLPSSEPRRIRTLSVRGDQADAGPAPPPAAASAKPAKSASAAPRGAPPAAANAPLSLAPDAQASAAAPEPRRVATLQPPPGAPNAPANAAASGGYLVQVSSQKSESDAQASYKSLQSRYPAVLGSHVPVIKRADLGDKGVYYRAMVGPFSTPEEASQFCGNLKTAGGQCVVQRN